MEYCKEMIRPMLGESGKVYNIGVMEGVREIIRVIGWMSIIYVIPLIWVQVGSYMSTGSTRRECKWMIKVGVVSCGMIIGGIKMMEVWVIPGIIGWVKRIMEMEGGKEIEYIGVMREYIEFVGGVMIGGVISGQIPIILGVMIRRGVVRRKGVIYGRKVGYMVGLIIAGGVAPPEVWSQVCIWIPIIIIYEVGVVGWIREKYRRRVWRKWI